MNMNSAAPQPLTDQLRALGSAARRTLSGHVHLLLPLAASLVVLVSHGKVLTGSLLISGDNLHHLLNEHLVVRAYHAADNVFGPLAVEEGSPVLRFYQTLFYFTSAGLHLVTGAKLQLLHGLLLSLCFGLSPFSYYYFLKKLGLPVWARSIGAMATVLSVAGFGNSFEAYHGCGIATQTMGAFFFPLFMGTFVGMLRGENRVTSAALLFALAFLSHAVMAVYSSFAGTLYLLVTPVGGRANLRRLALFTVLGVALVAFWVFPFISHTEQFRAVPDNLARDASKRWWFVGLSDSEMAEAFLTGKLLDDPREVSSEQTEPLDTRLDQINITKTRWTRPPVVTALTLLGLVVALVGFRRHANRFLATGFLFGLVLLTGPDDTPWLRYLPFMAHLQVFRTTYLMEFFAFGLVGLGLEAVGRRAAALISGRGPLARALAGSLFGVACAGALAFFFFQTANLARIHIHTADGEYLNAAVDVMGSIPEEGYPYSALSHARSILVQDRLAMEGWRVSATHWGGVVSSAELQLLYEMRRHPKNTDLEALAGRRFHLEDQKSLPERAGILDEDGLPLYDELPAPPRREGAPNSRLSILDNGREQFLSPLVGTPVPVVCGNAAWFWLCRTWSSAFAKKLFDEATPIPIRLTDEQLASGVALESAQIVLFLEEEISDDQREALRGFTERGGTVISPVEIAGLRTVEPARKSGLWSIVKRHIPRSRPNHEKKTLHRDELDPALEVAEIRLQEDPLRSCQRYDFDVEALREIIAVLPTVPVPGWEVTVDGEPVESFAAGPDLLAFFLPEGAHRVSARWSMPAVDRLFLLLSLLALLLTSTRILWVRLAPRARLLFSGRTTRRRP